MTTRAALGITISLTGLGGGREILEQVFASLPTSGREADVRVRFDVIRDDLARGSVDDVVIAEGTPDRTLAELITAVNVRAIDASDCLVVHASVVYGADGAIVIAANAGGGKSTLAAALTAAGLRYGSDETAPIDSAGLVHPYPKPIVVGQGSFATLSPLVRDAIVYGSDQYWLLDPDKLRGGVRHDPAPLRLVVVPRYRPDEVVGGRALSRAECVAALASNSFNYRTRRSEALDLLAAVTVGVRGLEVTYGSANEAVELVRSTLHR